MKKVIQVLGLIALSSSAVWAKETATTVWMGEFDGPLEGHEVTNPESGLRTHVASKIRDNDALVPKNLVTFDEDNRKLVFHADYGSPRTIKFDSFESAQAVKKSLEVSKHGVSIGVVPGAWGYSSHYDFDECNAAVILDTGDVVSMADFVEYAKTNPQDPYAVLATKRAQEREKRYVEENYEKQRKRIEEQRKAGH